jgi:endogenous inhibitor of DNA gyrase (YacG/DUF329 family)
MRCPTCKTEHERAADAPAAQRKLGPFCSPRCQLIDLGQWLGEEYRVADPTTPLSEEELALVLSARGDVAKA